MNTILLAVVHRTELVPMMVLRCKDSNSVIVGGSVNDIQSTGDYSHIGGGYNNTIDSSGHYNAILGGEGNTINGSLTDTFIVGSNITATISNTTFTENLHVHGTYTNNKQPALFKFRHR